LAEYYKLDSDFESSFGAWRQDKGAPLLWEITKDQTPNQESGPTKPFITR